MRQFVLAGVVCLSMAIAVQAQPGRTLSGPSNNAAGLRPPALGAPSNALGMRTAESKTQTPAWRPFWQRNATARHNTANRPWWQRIFGSR